ncbi:MAG: TolC family protein [Chthoniobacteraceae bacterium]
MLRFHLIFLALIVSALAAPRTFTLDSIPARVRTSNLELAAARMRIAEAQGRLTHAGRLGNPELEFDYARDTAAPREHTLSVAITQRLPLTSRLRHARTASRAQLDAAAAEVDDLETHLIAQAESAAIKLLAIKGQRAIRGKQLANSRERAAFLTRGADRGEVSTIDAAQMELETGMLEAELLQLDVEEVSLRGQLRPLLGLADTSPLELAGDLGNPKPLPPTGTVTSAHIKAATFTAAAAQASLAEQRASRFEDVGLSVLYERERFEDEPVGLLTEQRLGLRVSIPLPIWNTNLGRIQEAEATAERTRLDADALRLQTGGEAAAARAEMAALAKLLDNLDTRLLPKASDLEERLQQSYAAGQSPLIEVLRARDRRLQLQRQRLDALRDHHLAQVRHAATLGKAGFIK